MSQAQFPISGLPSPALPELLAGRGRVPRLSSDGILRSLSATAAFTILILLALLLKVIVTSSLPAIREFGFSFLTETQWRPNALEQPKRDAKGYLVRDADGEVINETIPPAFGALPVIYGTVVSSVLSLMIAVPMSMGAAIFLIRIAPAWLAWIVSLLIDFLAAIPSIAYGIWGLFVLGPVLRDWIEYPLNLLFQTVPGLHWLGTDGAVIGRDMFVGSVVLAIMVIPIITALSRNVLAAVPPAQVEGSIALGATWWQSCVEMLKFSRSGLLGAVMLGLARAAGETMAVTMVIGNSNQISGSIFSPAQTMSSLLANEFAEAGGGLHVSALATVALILLIMSLAFNVAANLLIVGKQNRPSAAH